MPLIETIVNYLLLRTIFINNIYFFFFLLAAGILGSILDLCLYNSFSYMFICRIILPNIKKDISEHMYILFDHCFLIIDIVCTNNLSYAI